MQLSQAQHDQLLSKCIPKIVAGEQQVPFSLSNLPCFTLGAFCSNWEHQGVWCRYFQRHLPANTCSACTCLGCCTSDLLPDSNHLWNIQQPEHAQALHVSTQKAVAVRGISTLPSSQQCLLSHMRFVLKALLYVMVLDSIYPQVSNYCMLLLQAATERAARMQGSQVVRHKVQVSASKLVASYILNQSRKPSA